MLNRYVVIQDAGFEREMLLLKGLPCKWGKCSFCDYIEDNSSCIDDINQVNLEVLSRVTGEYGVLDVINSGSVFELPEMTLDAIRKLITEKGIKELFVEAHWLYRKKFAQFRDSFDIPVRIRIGVETFNDDFRNQVLLKGMRYSSIEQVKRYADSICLMVGIKGQTKAMITKDMEILTQNFSHGAVSIFTDNATQVKADPELIEWFHDTYGYLEDYPYIDVLYNNLDYGVNA